MHALNLAAKWASDIPTVDLAEQAKDAHGEQARLHWTPAGKDYLRGLREEGPDLLHEVVPPVPPARGPDAAFGGVDFESQAPKRMRIRHSGTRLAIAAGTTSAVRQELAGWLRQHSGIPLLRALS